jgi:hypothetical protein
MKTEREIHASIEQNPRIRTALFQGRIQIVNLYKQQLLSLWATEGMSEMEKLSHFIEAVFNPYREYWTAFFDEDRFSQWVIGNWEELAETSNPGIQLPFEVDFDALFEKIAGQVSALSGQHIPSGKWYLVYRSESDMGGLTNGIMYAHLLNLGKRGPDSLEFILPHEINHQIFNETNGEKQSLLRRIIDEGLACYLNYLYWEKRHSQARNIDFTEEEWDWSIENERKIFDRAAQHLHSTDEEVIGQYSHWHRYPWDGTPDRLAYFIGFRICQAFVEKRGPDSWKEIYDLPVSSTLEQSGYASFILTS